MVNSIHEIFMMLHYSVIIEKIDRVHHMIRERFVAPTYIPRNYNEFCKIIKEYYQYHYKAWLAGPTMPDDLALSQARMYLEKGQGGFIQIAKNSLEGREGGLISAIDAIASGLLDDATEKYTLYVLTTALAPQDYDKKVAFMQSYLNEFSHVLPREKLMSAYELAANFDAFIKFHIEWINSFRSAVK